MEFKTKDIIFVPLSEIKLNPKNRNKHDEHQINQFVTILKANGFRNPGIISNQSGLLVAGHGRYLALQKIGAPNMPIMYQDFDSPEQEYQVAVSDNAIAAQAVLDLSNIHVDIQEMGPFDLDLLGIADFKLEPDPSAAGDGESGNAKLKDKFLLPPFSILDARQGYWQERKRAWLSLGIQSEIGRGGQQ